jgi:hypothetical protein
MINKRTLLSTIHLFSQLSNLVKTRATCHMLCLDLTGFGNHIHMMVGKMMSTLKPAANVR